MRRRTAFTLVELLVSMALIIFIMTILTEAFIGGLNSFQVLKANGDMDEKLRGVANQLRADLAADHFEGKKRLSDPNFWASGPPREGFFRIWQGSCPFPPPPSQAGKPPPGWDVVPMLPINSYEGSDYGIPSWRSVDHMLHFTVKLRGNDRTKFFAAPIPSSLGVSPLLTYPQPDPRFQPLAFVDANNIIQGVFHSQLAEVIYFLQPNGRFVSLTGGTPGSDYTSANDTYGPVGLVPLYNLYRRVLIIVPDNTWANVDHGGLPRFEGIPFVDDRPPNMAPYPPIPKAEAAALTAYAEFSSHSEIPVQPGQSDHTDLYFNNLSDLANPLHRYSMVHDPVYQGAQGVFQNPGVPSLQLQSSVSAVRKGKTITQSQNVYSYPKLGDRSQYPLYLKLDPQYELLAGSDLLLTDVVSFDVRLATPQSIARSQSPLGQQMGIDPFFDLFDSHAFYINQIKNGGNVPQLPALQDATGAQIPYDISSKLMASNNVWFSDNFLNADSYGAMYPAHPFGQDPRVFDTWTNQVSEIQGSYDYSYWNQGPTADPVNETTKYFQQATSRLPLQLQIQMLHITLRVYDPRTGQTRQTSFMQDM